MSKYALIQNIGRLTCLLCHLLHSRRFSGHFVEPGLCCISSNITHYQSEEEWSLYHNASLLINIRNWILRVFQRCLSKNCGCLSRFFTLNNLIFGRYVFIIVLFVTLIARFLFYVVVVSWFSYVNHALNYPRFRVSAHVTKVALIFPWD
jgi:hypothetical protein